MPKKYARAKHEKAIRGMETLLSSEGYSIIKPKGDYFPDIVATRSNELAIAEMKGVAPHDKNIFHAAGQILFYRFLLPNIIRSLALGNSFKRTRFIIGFPKAPNQPKINKVYQAFLRRYGIEVIFV